MQQVSLVNREENLICLSHEAGIKISCSELIHLLETVFGNYRPSIVQVTPLLLDCSSLADRILYLFFDH